MTPVKAHKLVAILEMCTWTFLIVGMVLKYSGVTEAVVPFAGGIHGFGFLCFVIVTIVIWVNNRWSFPWGIAGLAVSAIPFAAYPFALLAEKKGKLEGGWRFADGDSSKPQTLPDKGLAQLMRHPVRTVIILLVIVVVVFSTLLYLGPPVDVESVIENS